MKKYDFSGYATKNNLKCSDGRTILPDAFKHNDGKKVPLVWNHQHNQSENVLGHAILENRSDGVYAYGVFNDTESGQNAKKLVHNGDVTALSIYANQLQHKTGRHVYHGEIRELSLVLAGANPGAFIDNVLLHGETQEDSAIIYTGDGIELFHAEKGNDMAEKQKTEETVEDVFNTLSEKQKTVVYALIGEALSESNDDDDMKPSMMHANEDATIEEIFNTLNEQQKTAVYALIGAAISEESEGGSEMKQNAFEQQETKVQSTLTHADGLEILEMAKKSNIGTLKNAIDIFMHAGMDEDEDGTMAHAFSNADIETLFPDHKLIKPGAPDIVSEDNTWVNSVMNKVHKSPMSRVKTRQTDIRGIRNQAKNFKKGDEKKNMGNLKLVQRTTDPTTIYIKDAFHRDDIIDIIDFDFVQYQYGIMRGMLNEEVAMAVTVGDGRADIDDDKIDETKVRPIWKDDELYTIHAPVDVAAYRATLQGSDTSKSFGDNFVYAEAIVETALNARIEYKGSGNMDFYCTPQILNKMLLARDMNGRRIYSSKADLQAALNVNAIHTVEQYEGLTRTADTKTYKLLGLFVNMTDYNIGATKGGSIARFNQFDIDFNLEKFLMEVRISGALTRIKSAIALEEEVVVSQG